jgi:hypothetical protein
MTFNLDTAALLQTVLAALLLGVAKTLWNTVLAQRELRAEFTAHKELDEVRHEELERRLDLVA